MTMSLSASSVQVDLKNKAELIQKLTKAYQADQQVKYLHLQAEIEVLFQQLKTLQQRNNI